MKNILKLIVFMFSISVFAQDLTDDNGLKQGNWEIKYDYGKTKYIETFKDRVEKEFFKFYYNNGFLDNTIYE